MVYWPSPSSPVWPVWVPVWFRAPDVPWALDELCVLDELWALTKPVKAVAATRRLE